LEQYTPSSLPSFVGKIVISENLSSVLDHRHKMIV